MLAACGEPTAGVRRPLGMLDEIVRMGDPWWYLVAFAGAVHQNPTWICPQNHVVLAGWGGQTAFLRSPNLRP